MNDLYLGYKNLTRKRMRFALTLIAIVIAFLIYGVLASFQRSFNSDGGAAADERMITVNKINFTQSMPISYVNKIRALPGVAMVTHREWFGAYVREPSNFIVCFAMEATTNLAIYKELVLDPSSRESFLANRQGLIVGERLARTQGWKKGDRIPVQSNIYSRADGSHTWEMVIEGIFTGRTPEFDSNYMLFHYDYLNEARTFGRDATGMIVFVAKDPRLNDQIADQIDAMFANSSAETQTDTAKAFNRAFIAQMGNIALIITSVVTAAFFTILLIVGNTMMLAIRERTTEIAVLKTLGFSAARIFRLVLGESLLLSLLGGALGLALAYVALRVMAGALADTLPNMSLAPQVVLSAVAIMLTLGLVTGLLPALSAMRLNIVTALGRN